MKAILGIMAALLLSGSATAENNKPSDQQTAALESNGLIVISTFADEKSIASASTVIIRRADNHRRVLVLQIDNFAGKSDFSPGWGFLYGLQMSPGSYFLELGSMNPFRHYSRGSETLGFTVGAGTRTYLGEAYFSRTLEGGKHYGHIQMLDKADRDVPLFLSRNPGQSADMIVTSIPHKGEVF